MPKKRANGEGTIRKRESGIWEGRITLTDALGNKQRPSFYGETRKEVREQITRAQNQSDQGIYTNSSYTLWQWLMQWLWVIKEGEVIKKRLSPKTFDGYHDSVYIHIKEAKICDMKLPDIRKIHIQHWVDAKAKNGTKPYALKQAYGVIRNAMNEAVRQEIIAFNRISNISLPKPPKNEIEILNLEDQAAFLSAISGDRLEAMYIMALTGGYREGELPALSWQDIDLKTATVRISKSVVRIATYEAQEKTGTKLVIKDNPKTSAGVRTNPLHPLAVSALRKHKVRQAEEKMKNRKIYQDNNLVFCNECGQLYDPKSFYQAFSKILKRNGLKHIKFHALRHTFATRALEAGIQPKGLQDLLGHETPEMSERYMHSLDDFKRDEMARLDNVFKKES